MEPFTSMISLWPANFAPRNWAFCHGQLLTIQQNHALYSLLGTTFGGDGRTTFQLPDMRGRAPLCSGHGQGLSSYQHGSQGGVEKVALTVNTLPAHQHGPGDLTITLKANSEKGNSPSSNGHNTLASLFVPGATDALLYNNQEPDVNLRGAKLAGALLHTGANQPHENRQPYLAIHYIIALRGLFPSRN